jgi:hypothetical protein
MYKFMILHLIVDKVIIELGRIPKINIRILCMFS